MQQDVALELFADDEAEPAGRVEPFHPAGDGFQFRLSRIVVGLHFGPISSLGQL